MTRLGLTVGLCALLVGSPGAQSGAQRLEPAGAAIRRRLPSLVAFARTESDLRVAVDRYLLDKAAIERRYEVPYSPVRQRGCATFSLAWQKRLAEADFNGLNAEGKIDFVLLRNRIEYDLAMLALGRYAVAADGAAAAVLPTRCGCCRRIGTIASAWIRARRRRR